MEGQRPLLTVVMPVFNAQPFLDQAIQSILEQTYRDFRFVIYDDHSTDGSYERALTWAERDARITVYRGKSRLGPRASSAMASARATSEFVARMDADDVAMPDRIALEMAAMQNNPQAALVGSLFDIIDGNGKITRPAGTSQIQGSAPPIAHASILYRRQSFIAAGGYRIETDYFEDLDLYRRIVAFGDLLVIHRPLIALRLAGQHARLRDDKIRVLRQINRLYPPPHGSRSSKRNISPLAFHTLAILSIFAKQRPRLLGLMSRKMHFAQPMLAFKMTMIVSLAEAAPTLARSLSNLLHWARTRPNRRLHCDSSASRWIFDS